MVDRKEIIERFSNLLNNEIRQCIRQDIDFHELQDYKRILVLQSAPLNILERVISQICFVKRDMNFLILGQSQCVSIAEGYPENNFNVIKHDKTFDLSDLKIIEDLKTSYAFDAIIYFNNFVNSVDFSNVEQLLTSFEKKIPIYSYSYGQQELNRHMKISYHLYGILVYRYLLEWFKTWE